MQVAGSGRQVLDGAAVHAWAVSASDALARLAPRIDALNVFPVADDDTGTNVALTVAAGRDALARSRPAGGAQAVDVLARGALAAARGSSGVILGAWFTGLAEGLAAATGIDRADPGARDLVAALSVAARTATAAVERPSPGTMLDTAHQVARQVQDDALDQVLPGAVDAARRALVDTSRRHPVLRAAGVVDAGACALLVLLEALAAVLAERSGAGLGDWVPVARPHEHDDAGGGAYEVMAALGPHADADAVRTALGQRGDAVAVVGGPDGWRTHVHTDTVPQVLELLAAHELVQAVVRAVHGPHQPSAVVVTSEVGHAAWFAAAGAAVLLPGAVTDAALPGVVHQVAGPGAVVLATEVRIAAAAQALTDDPVSTAVACAAVAAGAPSAQVVRAALARLRRAQADDDDQLPAALASLLDDRVDVLTAAPASGAEPSALTDLVAGRDIDLVLLAPGGVGRGWLLGAE